MTEMLRVENVSRRFGGLLAVNGASLAANAGCMASSMGSAIAVPNPLRNVRLGSCFFRIRFMAFLHRRFAFGKVCY